MEYLLTGIDWQLSAFQTANVTQPQGDQTLRSRMGGVLSQEKLKWEVNTVNIQH